MGQAFPRDILGRRDSSETGSRLSDRVTRLTSTELLLAVVWEPSDKLLASVALSRVASGVWTTGASRERASLVRADRKRQDTTWIPPSQKLVEWTLHAESRAGVAVLEEVFQGCW